MLGNILFYSQEIRVALTIGVFGIIFALLFLGKKSLRGFEDISPSLFKEVRKRVENEEIDPHIYLKLLERKITSYEKAIAELEGKNLPIPSDIEEQLSLSKEELDWLKSRFKLNK